MLRYRLNDSLQLMQVLIRALQGLPVVQPCTLEQLVGLEGEDAGGGQARRIHGLEVDKFTVSQTWARMTQLAALGARFHGGAIVWLVVVGGRELLVISNFFS